MKGGCVSCGWSVMSVIVSGSESWSGVLVCRSVETGDSIFLDEVVCSVHQIWLLQCILLYLGKGQAI